jgi:hypothetical protein
MRHNVDYGLIWLCFDCTNLHANGDLPIDPPAADQPLPLSAIDPAEFTLTLGILDSEHSTGCNADLQAFDECTCSVDTFSTVQCDGCGTYLAGVRFKGHLWGSDTD